MRAQRVFLRDLASVSDALSGVGIEEFLGVTPRATQLWARGQRPAASMAVMVRRFALLADAGLDLTALADGRVVFEPRDEDAGGDLIGHGGM